jgi:hypothetical protein
LVVPENTTLVGIFSLQAGLAKRSPGPQFLRVNWDRA